MIIAGICLSEEVLNVIRAYNFESGIFSSFLFVFFNLEIDS